MFCIISIACWSLPGLTCYLCLCLSPSLSLSLSVSLSFSLDCGIFCRWLSWGQCCCRLAAVAVAAATCCCCCYCCWCCCCSNRFRKALLRALSACAIAIIVSQHHRQHRLFFGTVNPRWVNIATQRITYETSPLVLWGRHPLNQAWHCLRLPPSLSHSLPLSRCRFRLSRKCMPHSRCLLYAA